MITNLICTIFIYLLVPVIILIIGKKFKKSTLLKIAIINGVVIYIFFTTINIISNDFESANVVATFIWSFVGYAIMKKRCLLDSEKDSLIRTQSVVIPVFDRIVADVDIDSIEEIIETEEITEEMAKTGSFFALQISDNSMEPKISKGDVVIVKQQNNAETGDIVIVAINGDSATCKRLQKNENGISLISLNPYCEAAHFDYSEIYNKRIQIIGKVVELRVKFH